MSKAYADTPSDWTDAVRQRRKALLQRVGLGAASALIFSPLIGWNFSLLWVVGYFAIQLFDIWAFEPINSGKTNQLHGPRLFAGGLLLFSNSLYFGSLSIPLWLVGGTMGGICATILLSAGMIYSVVNAPRSKVVLALTVIPHMAYLAATPFFMSVLGASTAFTTATAIAVVVYVSYCLSTWSRLNAARTAEAQARVEADLKRVEAERIMESRSAFLAAVGHDLRTPISAILTGAAELERGAGNHNSRAQAQLITDAGVMMKALLDDLLDHAKLEAGHMTVEASDFDLRALLSQTVRLWRGPAHSKGLKLRVEGAASIPTMVRGDPMRLRQVLNNLLSNALKFTETGSVTLKLQAWNDELTRHALLVEIKDTGPGMSPTQINRLFTPFDQTAEGIGSRYGGSGLGLAISRQLVELMGGRLTARSVKGAGSSFTLALSLAESRTAAAPPEALDQQSRNAVAQVLSQRAAVAALPSAPSILEETAADDGDDDGRPLRVLVVDDHDINRRAIQLILQPLGCDIATAADGLAALKICEDASFDLIFMDVRMPELDGRETTRRLRSGSSANAATPVIAVTADTSAEDIAACMDAGMTYFVPKPITPALLLGAISHTLAEAGTAEDETAAVA
ncbi:ATP-binding protein [uncultured Brevundimonas sp.]|uniref:ATP-binding protein n=1 Tax=uncultured Brevundimonas sp. TaxID=213418 RepID=UPI0030ED71D7|tara:strand:- start:65369 stop:67246 length:1878 start_codon:yes stop_codon:yes gene_type:complete